MIKWEKVKHFSASEFVDDVTHHASGELILSLDIFRKTLGKRINPSSMPGSCVRMDGSVTSQHYAVNRKSGASDVFCSERPLLVFHKAFGSGLWGGIGVYFDTCNNDGVEHTMFHLDKRAYNKFPTVWGRLDGEYFNPIKENNLLMWMYGELANRLL